MRFRAPRIYHTTAVMVIDLAFYTKELDRVGDAVNVFLFPDQSPSASLESAMLTQHWDKILGEGALKYFTDTSILMDWQKVDPIT